jgi:hypothetical protein
MRYFLDVNALLILYSGEKYNLEIYKKTGVSKLVISEMLKIYNWKKDYEERRNQLLFINKNDIKINWSSCDLLITKSFGFDSGFISNENKLFDEQYIIDTYRAILAYDTYEIFLREYFGKLPFVGRTRHIDGSTSYTEPTEEELNKIAQYIENYYYKDFLFHDLLLSIDKNYHGNMEEYQIEKKIKEDFLRIIINEINKHIKTISVADTKHLFRERLKKYDKSLDLFIKSKTTSIKNREDVMRNDGVDLLHLLYVNKNNDDIFVTNDGNLRSIIKSVSDKSTITIEEYLVINDTLSAT